MKEAKKSKKIVLGIAAVAIAAMMVIPTGITMANGRNETDIPFGFSNAKKMPFEVKELGTNTATEGCTGNVLVTPNSQYDDVLPVITKDGDGNIVVSFTQEISVLQMEMGWSVSSDNGASWNDFATTSGGANTYNSIAWEDVPNYRGLFGVYLNVGEDTEGFYTISDATDPSTYTIYTWTASDNTDPTYACISDNTYLEGQYNDIDGPTNMYIEHLIYSSYDIPNCPNQMITGFDENGEVTNGEGTFDGQSHLLTAPAYDPSMSGEHMKAHYAWQYDNQTTGKSQIVWKKIIPVEGNTDSTDIEFTPYQEYLDEGQHPYISHSGNNVVVVYMNNDNIYGDWDIKCAYSIDDGQNWDTSMVAEGHPTDETYPAVYMSGNTAFVVYISDGNLYLVKSEDGGATWGDPEQVNDEDGTVVAEENAVDIHSGGIVWVDNRNGNKDIYYAPLPAPLIGVKTISGGVGVKATIDNTGSEDASNVDWSIQLSGLIFMGKEATGTIDTLAAGGETTISTGLVFGVGPTTITVTAGGATKTASGFVLGPLVLGVK